MTWTISEKGKVFDIIPKRINDKPAFSVVPHRLGGRYPNYPIGKLARAAGKIARNKYYWGIKYYDRITGELHQAKRIDEYCNAFLDYVLSEIGPIVPFPQSKRWDKFVKAKIANETNGIDKRHEYFRKISRKRRKRHKVV